MTGSRTSWSLLIALALAGAVGCASSSHNAYVTVPSSNAVQGYRINNDSGAFTTLAASPFPAGLSPISIAVHPANRFAYVANQSGNNISILSIDPKTGSLTEILPQVAAGITPVALAMDSAGQFLFAANEASGSISTYTINAGTGALTAVAGSPFPTGPSPQALAIAPSGAFLYVVDTNLSVVFAYSIASGGVLTSVPGSPFAVAAGPLAMTIDPAGNFAYIAESTANSVSVVSLNSTTGALAAVSGSPFAAGTNPAAVITDISGKYLYVANLGSNDISEYSIDSTTGFLSPIINNSTTGNPITSSTVTVTSPVFLLADPDGKFIYAGSQSTKSVMEFTIADATGVLTVTGQAAGTNTSPSSMALTK